MSGIEALPAILLALQVPVAVFTYLYLTRDDHYR